jgi:hypothetical protein
LWRKEWEVQLSGVSLNFLTYDKPYFISPTRADVEKFFERSVNAIVEGIKGFTTGTDPENTVWFSYSLEINEFLTPSFSLFSSPEVLQEVHGYSRKSGV